MAHALALGAAGMLLGSLATVATWNAGPAFGPRWCPIALPAMAPPVSWLGGKLGG